MSANQVIRVRKEKGFTILDNGIFKDTMLSMKAKGLLATLLSLPEDWNFSTSGLAKLCNDGETAVRSALKELEQNGYLNREAVREKGIIIDWKYTIYEERQPKDFTKKPDVENHHVDNSPQLSTNKSSTKELNNNVSTKVDTEFSNENPSMGDMVLIPGIEDSPNIINSANQIVLTNSRKAISSTPKEDKPRKPNLYERCQNEIVNRYGLGKLNASLHEYLGYRIRSKLHPMGYSGWVGMLNKLDKLASTEDDKCAIVEQSMRMKWDTFVELKTWGKPRGRAVFSETPNIKSGQPIDTIMDDTVF